MWGGTSYGFNILQSRLSFKAVWGSSLCVLIVLSHFPSRAFVNIIMAAVFDLDVWTEQVNLNLNIHMAWLCLVL